MIRSFRSKALAAFWTTGSTAKLDASLVPRIKIRLSRLDQAQEPAEMNVPGFNFHQLSGDRAGTYSVHVNGPWCITFIWDNDAAVRVDLEQYH
jgi:proteic killer suppression protein